MADHDWLEKLIKASESGDLSEIELALLHTVDVNDRGSRPGNALHWAAYRGHFDCLERLLLVRGIDLDLPNREGKTALRLAAEEGYSSCVKRLLEAGADPETLNKQKQAYQHMIDDICEPIVYQAVNENIVVKNEGTIPGAGKLRKIFDFRARTVTEVINDNPGQSRFFKEFRDNQQDIQEAYDWLKAQGQSVPHPFKAGTREIPKRH